MKRLVIISIIFLITHAKGYFAVESPTEGKPVIISIAIGDITKQSVDAIVNPIQKNRFLSELNAFGTETRLVKELCTILKRGSYADKQICSSKDIIVTPERNGKNRAIFNVLVPPYPFYYPKEYRAVKQYHYLSNIYVHIINKAIASHINSIAIPPIGTKQLNYHIKYTARDAIRTIIYTLMSFNVKDLQEIRIIVDNQDDYYFYLEAIKMYIRLGYLTPISQKLTPSAPPLQKGEEYLLAPSAPLFEQEFIYPTPSAPLMEDHNQNTLPSCPAHAARSIQTRTIPRQKYTPHRR